MPQLVVVSLPLSLKCTVSDVVNAFARLEASLPANRVSWKRESLSITGATFIDHSLQDRWKRLSAAWARHCYSSATHPSARPYPGRRPRCGSGMGSISPHRQEVHRLQRNSQGDRTGDIPSGGTEQRRQQASYFAADIQSQRSRPDVSGFARVDKGMNLPRVFVKGTFAN